MLLDSQAQSLVELALKEDTGSGDITSEAIFPPGHRSTATITARENLVVCGLDLARNVFEKVDPGIDIQLHAHDGDSVESGVALLRAEGNTISLLTAERTVLNFLQHLTGIATRAREYAAAVEQSDIDVRILDTRKTTPGWRMLEKYAVRCGGCHNHRFSLGDEVLIKENHIAAAGSVAEAVRKVRARLGSDKKIEVEAENQQQVKDALAAGADIIMLDNMSPLQVKEMVALIDGAALVEVSGGINLDSIADYLVPGVDMISVGALTHSAPAADISMSISLS